ncbi:inositol polyphosphate multikinase-like [Pseudomyrmex gracilis]|uniref:inositol polyphosphate multikinase-like n=1 Tax=Pseudomyrmex gracilis TaxID=219809 RepID=UPI00099598A5|nr:inositol polyphosphate multikinase-like [Pseudomyrmex gracilis]XP_020296195.1 inositol polyphosphate multikinase-like [Pseudomyrmex gracilis]XP_020296196.1 inositol polyphosphate multikinase-like [Pseudomyrmex gracilis]XP_020296197.1 inositol polyphosphate multikinase-like [Pseudomyrmex gracilis]
MTTRDTNEDQLDNLPHVEWNSTASGASGNLIFPSPLSPLKCQIAGHPFNGVKHTIGMLVCRKTGNVLKPATKVILGEREIAFYENLKNSRNPTIVQLKKLVPCYYGTTELWVFNKRTKFLKLRNITDGMAEPCVMDIKIGRRTWDPLATPEKKATEELKYAESKRAYGFCITGFQVYCHSTGRLKKFDRDYGKKLDAKGVVEALKTFLNITPERPACRHLLFELLSCLGRIMLFFRMQRKYRFYSSSLLVAYDAKKLREHYCADSKDSSELANSKIETVSFSTTSTSLNTNTSEQSAPTVPVSSAGINRDWTEAQKNRPTLKRSTSFNTEPMPIMGEQISDQSGSYNPDLKMDRLCQSCPSQFSLPQTNNVKRNVTQDNHGVPTNKEECSWVRVNMIDFTHVFPADDNSGLDLNYLEGIENLITLINTLYKQAHKRDSNQNCSATIAQ